MKLKTLETAHLIPYLVPVFSLGLSILLLTFIVIPRFRGISELRSEVASARGQLGVLKAKSDKLAKLNSSMEILKNNDKLFTQVMPDREEVPTLMNQVQRISDESGVDIRGLVFARRQAAGLPETMKARLVSLQASVTGSFSAIQTFLENMEKASRILEVSNLSFNRSANEVNANMSISAYFFESLKEPSIEEPVKLDLNSQEFGEIVGKGKNLKYYETVVDVGTGIGKEDPFR